MLEISCVHKRFDGIHALNDVSLSVKEGEIVAMVGDNGAGKSTLMKCISGVINPDSGNIIFNGEDLTASNPHISREAGIEMIYQDLALCRKHDAVVNVFLGHERRKGIFLDKACMLEECQQVFTELGISIPMKSFVGDLSGGQQQAIAITRALLSKPKLLIMDEPTAALAVKETENVLDHIKRIKERGVSVIMISHNLADVFKVADRIIVMKSGGVKYDLVAEQTDIKDLTLKIVGS